MTTKMSNVQPIPPPPPTKKNPQKTLVVAFLIVIVVVSAIALAYIATGGFGSNNNTTPTATPTPHGSPTANPTITPSGSATQTATPQTTPTSTGSTQQTVANFRAGAWANYTVMTYESTGESMQSTLGYSVEEATYNGIACYIMKMEMQMDQDGVIMKTITSYWMNKNTLDGVHMKMQIYTNGELTYETEEDITPYDQAAGDIPEPVDLSSVTTYETITVPAGTFNCGKITATSSSSGTVMTTTEWINADIPLIGLVKSEISTNGQVTTSMTLIAYGN